MGDFLVIAVHETNKIFFVKRSDIDTILIIEFINEVSILITIFHFAHQVPKVAAYAQLFFTKELADSSLCPWFTLAISVICCSEKDFNLLLSKFIG